MLTFSRRCEKTVRDSLECDVVGGHIFIGAYAGVSGAQNDIMLTPESARELIEWLESAVLEADSYEA